MSSATDPPPNKASVNFGDRYIILRELTSGGLGDLWVCHDEILKRDVILKKPKKQGEQDKYTEVERETFREEAKATAKLEHPNIVPIYDYRDGKCPGYVMRFIRESDPDKTTSGTYEKVIDLFHKNNMASSNAFESPRFRELIKHFNDVCHAIEFAHAQGVCHNDLKPNNIMVGQFGETQVIDWGGSTSKGIAFGASGYAAPEQRGHFKSEEPKRIDVYGLGGVLFYLLTQKIPNHVANDEIDYGVSRSPRLENPKVPKALDSICLKALQTKPGDRYDKVADLREDIFRWLAKERVLVHKETLWEWAVRFVRRHASQTIASMIIFAVLVVFVVAFAVYATWMNRQLDREKEAVLKISEIAVLHEKVAVDNKKHAIEGFNIAKNAVYRNIDFVNGSLRNVPGLEGACSNQMKIAEMDFKNLGHIKSNDPELELMRIQSIVYLGDIQAKTYQSEDALETFEEAISAIDDCLKRFESLVGIENVLDKLRVEKALIRVRIGRQLNSINEATKAESAFKTAKESLFGLHEKDPKSSLFTRALATMLVEESTIVEKTKGPKASLEILDCSLALFQTLSKTEYSQIYAGNVADCQVLRGRMLTRLGQTGDAWIAFENARESLRKQRTENGDSADLLLKSARLDNSIANGGREEGKTEKALSDLESAEKTFSTLLKTFPTNPNIDYEVASVRSNIGDLQLEMGNPQKASEYTEQAIIALRELEKKFPERSGFREGLATSLSLFARASSELGRDSTEVEKDFHDSLDMLKDLSDRLEIEKINHSQYDLRAAVTRIYYARHKHFRKDFDSARQLLVDAVTTLGQLEKSSGNKHETSQVLAEAYFRRGLLESDKGKADDADMFLKYAEKIRRERLSDTPSFDKPSLENQYQLAKCLLRMNDPDGMKSEEALKLMKHVTDVMVKIDVKNFQFDNLLAEAYALTGDMESAQQLLDKIKTERGEWNASDYCILARIQKAKDSDEVARKSIDEAQKWATEHRPNSDDVIRQIAETKESLFPGEDF